MPDECDEKNCLCICNGVKRENCFELSVCKGDEIVLKFREKYAASFYLGQSENIFVEKQAGEIFLSKTSFDTALIDELFSKEFLKEFRILVNNCLLLREGESADDFLVDVQKSSLQKKIKASLESFRIGKSREIGYDLSMKVYVKFYSNGKQVSGPSHNFYALEYVKETLATADLDNFEKRVDELLCGDESKLSASYSVYLSKPKS